MPYRAFAKNESNGAMHVLVGLKPSEIEHVRLGGMCRASLKPAGIKSKVGVTRESSKWNRVAGSQPMLSSMAAGCKYLVVIDRATWRQMQQEPLVISMQPEEKLSIGVCFARTLQEMQAAIRAIGGEPPNTAKESDDD